MSLSKIKDEKMETIREMKPVNGVDLNVEIPGSKSYSNRALAIAALAKGESVLENILISDDTIFMVRALEKLGIWINHDEENNKIKIIGGDGHFPEYFGEIYVQNAGTAMRFLTSMLTLGKGSYLLSGNERMCERPIKDLIDALKSLGVNIKASQDTYPPVIVEGGELPGGSVSIRGNTSSQYISSLLISAPYAKEPLEINIDGELVSAPYIEMTIDLMRMFGSHVVSDELRSFRVKNNYGYTGRHFVIEPDATNASYFLAMPAAVGGRVRIEKLGYNSHQGDVKFVDILEKMGCEVERGEDYLEVRRDKNAALHGVEVNMMDMPDVAQTLAVIAMNADSPTKVFGVKNLRIKETNRIEAVANEIRVLGGKIDTAEDGFTIYPQKEYNTGKIATYDDHRMAMAFSLAGMFIEGVEILNPHCVNKTFPKYFDVLDEKIYKGM